MKFLVDNQLPPALARFIQKHLGKEASHVTHVGLRDASDSEIWMFAASEQWIVISKDEDFSSMILKEPTAKLI